MIKVAVIGATGYAGAELVRLLTGHSKVEVTTLCSRQYAQKPFSHIYPAFAGIVDQECESVDLDRIAQKADVVFMALPHKIPMGMVPELLAKGVRVIDLSADFRFKDAKTYEAYYETHTAQNLLKKAVYGLSEIYSDELRGAELVGNPGCYPTCSLLPLVPLLKERLIDPATIIIDAKSGVSGAGRGVSLGTHFCQINDSFKAYNVGAHRHTPEIEAILSDIAGQPVSISFTPHLVPMTRGMLCTIYAGIGENVDEKTIRNCLTTAYADSPFVRIMPPSVMPDTLQVRGTNYCDIGFHVDSRTRRIYMISVIDNLVKGAAGQAVQNLNLMFGLEETMGLDGIPWPI